MTVEERLAREVRAINAPEWLQDRAHQLAGIYFKNVDEWFVDRTLVSLIGGSVTQEDQDRWMDFVPIALAEHLDLNGFGVGHE
jgi:hypothetical protein